MSPWCRDVDTRYFGSDNFVGERIDGYQQPRCVVSALAAKVLRVVARDLAMRGLALKAFESYGVCNAAGATPPSPTTTNGAQ